MANVLLDLLASSTAHGISRAAATNSIPLRVGWILLFLLFLGLFGNSAVTVVNKLINVSIVTSVEMDQVPFEAPDIYVCSSGAFSGSYPYTLNASEAAMVNDDVERLGKQLKQLNELPAWRYSAIEYNIVSYILQSLDRKAMKLLIQRSQQSVSSSMRQAVFLDDYTYCFKIMIDSRGSPMDSNIPYAKLASDRVLFTDPYNPHVKYSGHPVNPIVQRSERIELPHWDIGSTKNNGYTMVFVSKGAMPILESESSLKLAPGLFYDIKLSMEKLVYSEDLHGKNCSPREPNLEFMDRLSGDKLVYNFSYEGCLADTRNRILLRQMRYLRSRIPFPWDLRDSPQLGNIAHMVRYGNLWENMEDYSDRFISMEKGCPLCACMPRKPCTSVRYKAAYSTLKWPKFDGKYSHLIDTKLKGPGIDQLRRIANQLDSGNHSTDNPQLESEFRNYLSNSLVKYDITFDRQFYPLLVIATSYSWTAFLADIGGLLGLYIGCSLLTFCELLELLYHLAKLAACRRAKGDGDAQLPEAALLHGVTKDEQLTEV